MIAYNEYKVEMPKVSSASKFPSPTFAENKSATLTQ